MKNKNTTFFFITENNITKFQPIFNLFMLCITDISVFFFFIIIILYLFRQVWMLIDLPINLILNIM